ncbi:hypothetical protein [Azospirillum picis]|uniref:Uncharacterized protein n=1 Tax=Azospirillum picis TaxID=488438 RepID=A0ABU0MPF8_9PROT|nr:hypothetical protein [Azospirillum picis]MBP2301526.1 hypothetical protein [Azospirillum picis]MDQ0535358.1 hypothetical protein [Azospirillum picis]
MRPSSRAIRSARRHAARHRFDHLEGRDSPSPTDDAPEMPALELALARAEAEAYRAGQAA